MPWGPPVDEGRTAAALIKRMRARPLPARRIISPGRAPSGIQADLFLGTFLPCLRAFDKPMAIACLRLLTLPPLPPLPLCAVPRLYRCISDSTSRLAPREYFRFRFAITFSKTYLLARIVSFRWFGYSRDVTSDFSAPHRANVKIVWWFLHRGPPNLYPKVSNTHLKV